MNQSFDGPATIAIEAFEKALSEVRSLAAASAAPQPGVKTSSRQFDLAADVDKLSFPKCASALSSQNVTTQSEADARDDTNDEELSPVMDRGKWRVGAGLAGVIATVVPLMTAAFAIPRWQDPIGLPSLTETKLILAQSLHDLIEARQPPLFERGHPALRRPGVNSADESPAVAATTMARDGASSEARVTLASQTAPEVVPDHAGDEANDPLEARKSDAERDSSAGSAQPYRPEEIIGAASAGGTHSSDPKETTGATGPAGTEPSDPKATTGATSGTGILPSDPEDMMGVTGRAQSDASLARESTLTAFPTRQSGNPEQDEISRALNSELADPNGLPYAYLADRVATLSDQLASERKAALEREKERADALARELTQARAELREFRSVLEQRRSVPSLNPWSAFPGPAPSSDSAGAQTTGSLAPPPGDKSPAGPTQTMPETLQVGAQSGASAGSNVAGLPSIPEERVSPPSPEDVRMVERAETLLERRDISAALLLLERVARKGNARATLLMAQIYDPVVLSRMGVIGFRGDPEKARVLYERARRIAAAGLNGPKSEDVASP